MLRGQAVGLRQLGCRVGLAVRAPQDDPIRQVGIASDLTEHRYPVRRTSEPAYVLSSLRGSIEAFDRACGGARPDAAVIHQAIAGLGPILRRRASAEAWIYLCLSLAHEEYRSRTVPSSMSRLRYLANETVRRWCERVVMRRCDRVVVLSEFMRQRVQDVHGIAADLIHLIPGAVDVTRFAPSGDQAGVRRHLGLPADRTVLVTVRNLVPRMGLEAFVRAVAMVRADVPGILVLIGGEGPLRAELERLIQEQHLKDHVRMLGYVPEDELPKYYQAADLVVLPTAELEGFGLVTVEALACGTPVVGTPVGATPEILNGIDPFLLTRDTSAGALADALRAVIGRFRAKPGERAALAAKGVEVVRARYTWDRHCARLLEVCAGAAAGRRGVMTTSGPHRVIHVITRLDRGGSAQNTLLTALGHDRSRFLPLVIAGLPEPDDAQGGSAATAANTARLDQTGVRWRILPLLTRPISPFRDLIVLAQLAALFRRERPAIVHTHTSKAGLLGRLAAWFAGVPVVVHTPHGHVFYGHFSRLASWWFLQLERLLARRTTWMIALTEAERDEHLARGVGRADRFAVVPSGIELARFREAGERCGRRPEGFDCPSDAIVVGSVGWLTPVKGHRILLEAAARIKQKWPRLHVVIVGGGPLRDELVRLARTRGLADAVRFLGMRDDVPDCLAGTDIYVQPSLNEGMGRALIEAMAAGRPVVASRTGGIPAIVEDRKTGLLVPPGDPGALAAAIAELIEHPELARALGQAARERIGEVFSVPAMVRAVEAVYDEALKRAGVA